MGRQRGGTRRPSSSRGTQPLADLQRRMGHQQERWKETTRRIRWRLQHPRPTLKQSLGEKKRQVTFEARHQTRSQTSQQNTPRVVSRGAWPQGSWRLWWGVFYRT